MKKQVAVLGAGVAGLAATAMLNIIRRKTNSDFHIDLISPDIGGDYLKGGLKFLHHSKYVQQFLTDLNLTKDEYYINAVRGAIMVNGEINPYPEFFLKLANNNKELLAKKIQKLHWDKTRSEDIINYTCMNDPWGNGFDFEVKFYEGLEYFVSALEHSINESFKYVNDIIDTKEKMMHIINYYDLIIYTIPAWNIIKYLELDVSAEVKKLSILRYDVFQPVEIWWDYLYMPESIYPFHRISKTNISRRYASVDVEISGELEDQADFIDEQLYEFLRKNYGIVRMDIARVNEVVVNGHIKVNNNIQSLVPGHVKLLGRFAELDSRMTLDKVIEKMYNKKDFIFGSLL